MLNKGSFDHQVYTFHSIRSGHGIDLLKLGVSVETIKNWVDGSLMQYFNTSTDFSTHIELLYSILQIK